MTIDSALVFIGAKFQKNLACLSIKVTASECSCRFASGTPTTRVKTATGG
jgi:hypothetical protein